MCPQAHIIRVANIIRRSRHNLPQANIIQKTHLCLDRQNCVFWWYEAGYCYAGSLSSGRSAKCFGGFLLRIAQDTADAVCGQHRKRRCSDGFPTNKIYQSQGLAEAGYCYAVLLSSGRSAKCFSGFFAPHYARYRFRGMRPAS